LHISEGYGDTIFKICLLAETALQTHLYRQVKICPILTPPPPKKKGKKKKNPKNKENQKIKNFKPKT